MSKKISYVFCVCHFVLRRCVIGLEDVRGSATRSSVDVLVMNGACNVDYNMKFSPCLRDWIE